MWDNATRRELCGWMEEGNGRVAFNRFITVWGRSVVFVYPSSLHLFLGGLIPGSSNMLSCIPEF